MVTTRLKAKPSKQSEGEARFICSSTLLYRAVRIVSQIIKKTHPLPILDNVLLSLEKNTLTVSATNLDKSLIETIEVESNHMGQIAVPAELLRDLLKYFPDCALSFKMVTKRNDYHFYIVSESGKYKIGAHDASEFPVLKNVITPKEAIAKKEKPSVESVLAGYNKQLSEHPDKVKEGVEKIKEWLIENKNKLSTFAAEGFEFNQMKEVANLK